MNKKLFIGTVPTNKRLSIGTIPTNKKLFGGTVQGRLSTLSLWMTFYSSRLIEFGSVFSLSLDEACLTLSYGPMDVPVRHYPARRCYYWCE